MDNFDEYLTEYLKAHDIEVVYEDIDNVSEDEYVNIRMDWLGASDSSKLLDVNPFPNGSCSDLIYEKVNCVNDPEISKKASVRMGKDVEHIILSKLQQYFFLDTIKKPKDMYGNLRNHLGVNFDAVYFDPLDIEHPVPFEIKTVTKYGRKYYDFSKSTYYQKDGEWQSQREVSNDESKEAIPIYYYTQLQQQMLFLRSEYGYLAVLDADNWDVHIFKINADHALWEELETKAFKVWNQILISRKIKENKKA